MLKGILCDEVFWQPRLASISPPIVSCEDFLTRDIVHLSCSMACHTSEVEHLKLLIGNKLLSRSHPTTRDSAADWLNKSVPVPSTQLLSLANRKSGWAGFDQMFNGSIPACSCVQIIGSDSNYRAHIAAATAIACAEEGLNVLCIDTCNQMVPMLFKRILDARSATACPGDEVRQQERNNCIIDQLHFKQSFDIWALMNLLCVIKDTPDKTYDVIIIDCIHHIIAPYVTEKVLSGMSYKRSGRTLPTRQYTATRVATSSPSGVSAREKELLQATSVAIDTPTFEPIVAQLGLLLKELAKGSTTIFVTNVCSSRTLAAVRQDRGEGLSTMPMYSILSAATGYAALGSGVFDISILVAGYSIEQDSAVNIHVLQRPPFFQSCADHCTVLLHC